MHLAIAEDGSAASSSRRSATPAAARRNGRKALAGGPSGRLAGRVCLVAGGASGIGAVTAELFGREGAAVATVDLRPAELSSTLTGDVADEDDVHRVVEEVADRFGRIDVLVNNAGISGVGDLAETTPERGDEVMRVNARSVFLMSPRGRSGMLERRFGVVVNVASAIAETGLARRVSYAASKARYSC